MVATEASTHDRPRSKRRLRTSGMLDRSQPKRNIYKRRAITRNGVLQGIKENRQSQLPRGPRTSKVRASYKRAKRVVSTTGHPNGPETVQLTMLPGLRLVT